MIKLNGFSLESISTSSGESVLFKKFFSICFDFMTVTNITKELRNVSSVNVTKTSGGRHTKTYINGRGVVEYLSKTTRISNSAKQEIIRELNYQGVCDMVTVFNTRKEIDFFSELSDFLLGFNIKITTQKEVEGYVVDCVVDGKMIAIEYDEDSHVSYSKEKEEKREALIRSNGYRVVRVSDKESNGANMAKVWMETMK